MTTDLFQLTLCLLGCAAAGMGGIGLWVLQSLSASVKELNEKMAVICEQVTTHEYRLGQVEGHQKEHGHNDTPH
jgi:hypothetical protein